MIVDGRFELAPEARVVELARVALCLGVTVRTGAPLREAARVSAAARAANPGPQDRVGRRPRDARPGVVPGHGRRWTPVPSARARRRWPPPWKTCARGATSARGTGWRWPGTTLLRREASPAPATLWPRADYSLLDVERHFERRGARRLDYCSSRGARDGPAWMAIRAERVVAEARAAGRAVPPVGDPLPGRGLLRRPGAGGRDRPGPRRRRGAARLAGGGAAGGRRGVARPSACASSRTAAAAGSTWAWRRACRRASS